MIIKSQKVCKASQPKTKLKIPQTAHNPKPPKKKDNPYIPLLKSQRGILKSLPYHKSNPPVPQEEAKSNLYVFREDCLVMPKEEVQERQDTAPS